MASHFQGKQEDLEAPFEFNFGQVVGEPVRDSTGLTKNYTATPDGVPGNDDCGSTVLSDSHRSILWAGYAAAGMAALRQRGMA